MQLFLREELREDRLVVHTYRRNVQRPITPKYQPQSRYGSCCLGNIRCYDDAQMGRQVQKSVPVSGAVCVARELPFSPYFSCA